MYLVYLRILVICLCSLALPAPAEIMSTGDALSGAISGNTISGASAGKTYASYYAEDGRVLTDLDTKDGRLAADIVGTWSIVDHSFCTNYGTGDPVCMEARLQGHEVTFFMYGMEQNTSQILPGNPFGL